MGEGQGGGESEERANEAYGTQTVLTTSSVYELRQPIAGMSQTIE